MNHNPTGVLNMKNKSIRPQRGRIFVEKNKRPPTLTTSEKSCICRSCICRSCICRSHICTKHVRPTLTTQAKVTLWKNMRPLARSCGDVIMGRCYQYLTSSEVRALPKIGQVFFEGYRFISMNHLRNPTTSLEVEHL